MFAGNTTCGMKSELLEPAIPAAFSRQVLCLDELMDVVGALEVRLVPVLRPSGPEPGREDECIKRISSAPIADALSNNTDRITDAVTRIRRLLVSAEI